MALTVSDDGASHRFRHQRVVVVKPPALNLAVVVVPFRGVEEHALAHLREDLANSLGVQAQLLPPIGVAHAAYSPARGQYRAQELLREVKRRTGGCALGVTDADLYEDDLNFVFGLAESPGRAAIISTARLRLGADESRFRERVFKEAVHELGHTFGLPHCSDRQCVMHFSNSLADTDHKGSRFCPRCRTRLSARPS